MNSLVNMRLRIFKTHQQTNRKEKFKGIWMASGGNAVSKERQCFATQA